VQEVYQGYNEDTKSSSNEESVPKLIKEVQELIPSSYSTKISYLLFNAIFDINIAKNVEKNKVLLAEMYKTLGFSAGNSEIDLLLNLEIFLLRKNASVDFHKYIPTILQLFWKEELLSDEVLIDWDQGKLDAKFMMDFRYEKVIDTKFKEAAKPFLEWLK